MKKNGILALVSAVGLAFALVYTVTASTGTGYVSVSAAAFQPVSHGYEYANSGYLLSNTNDSSINYVAPVQLPNGATVNKVTFYFFDGSSGPTDYGRLQLYGNELNGDTFIMADIMSTDGGIDSNYDDEIENATIDNSQYSYYMRLTLNSSVESIYGVIIGYTYQTNLSLVLNSIQASLKDR
jgi:hypothetical protein